MKAAINVWTWGTQSPAQFEQGVKEVADIGYHYVENLIGIGDLYEDAKALDEMLARYGVQMICGYFHLTRDWESDLERAKRGVRFLAQHGVGLMNIQAAPRPELGPTPSDLATTVERIDALCGLAQAEGIVPCLHAHYGTMIEQADDLAYVTDRLPPARLWLTLDTAHTVLGGMDPVETATRYASRIGFVHAKDISTVRAPGAHWAAAFRELGRGVVDLPGVVQVLQHAGYEGYLCVELDMPRVSGYKSAAISHAYLRDEFGL
ncbi:MAG: sugar phosphate isomerase/epimerase family protein [Anaerolineae bacterium]